MSFEAFVGIGLSAFTVIIIVFIAYKKIPKKLKQEKFADRWKQLQQRCADESQWQIAIIEADNLLDEALKKKRFKGNSIGERLVEAQKNFTDNDAVWFGHKLRTKIDINPDMRLAKNDVQKALFGFRQGLKDIGAL